MQSNPNTAPSSLTTHESLRREVLCWSIILLILNQWDRTGVRLLGSSDYVLT
jgi:hypothetical protein